MSGKDEGELIEEGSMPASDDQSLSLSSAKHRASQLLSRPGHYSFHILSPAAHANLEYPLPPLLDVTPAVRSLIWQYMNNHSAVHYLSTCKQLRGLYHSFPLTEAVSDAQFTSIITHVRGKRPMLRSALCCVWMLACCVLLVVVLPIVTVTNMDNPSLGGTLLAVFLALSLVATVLWCFFPERRHCCDDSGRLKRQPPMPRIIRLDGACSVQHLPFLQHVVELHSFEERRRAFTARRFSSSLRVLMMTMRDYGKLKADTLPAQLRVLGMREVNEAVLQPGVLPESLQSLAVRYKCSVREQWNGPQASVQRMAAGVLPSQLQTLAIDWTRSLADLALPPSVTQLELDYLPNLPIPPYCLPPRLRTLRIDSIEFHPHQLTGVLPSSLRVLRLHCVLAGRLTAEILSQVPQLEELDLDLRCGSRLPADIYASLSRLRVLRTSFRLPVWPGELPPSLQRLVVVAESQKEADALVPVAARHEGLVVDFDSTSHDLDPVLYYVPPMHQHVIDNMRDESRRMKADTLQQHDEESAWLRPDPVAETALLGERDEVAAVRAVVQETWALDYTGRG